MSRQSNFELYRILCLIMVVSHHFVLYSGLMDYVPDTYHNIHSSFLVFLCMSGKTGINCFLMITGYYMCKKDISIRKYAKLILEVIFYNTFVYSASVVFGGTSFSPFILIKKMFFPIWNIGQNFTSCFLVFYLFIPFLNILLNSLSKRQHQMLLGLLLLFYVFAGTVPSFHISLNYAAWFAVIYLIASYIRLYPCALFDNKPLFRNLTMALFAVAWVSCLCCTAMGKYPFHFIFDVNKFFAVSIAVSMFLWFKNIKIKPSRIINTIAASTFGVLLIHDNSAEMRQWLWCDLFACSDYYGLPFFQFAMKSTAVILLVYFGCATADMFRVYFLEKPFFKWFDKRFVDVDSRAGAGLNRLFDRLPF